MIRTRTPPAIVAADRLTPTAAAPTAAAAIAAAEPNASAALAATLPASPMASPACPSSDHFEASGTRAPACGPAALAMGPDWANAGAQALERGDLAGFWRARVGFDPVARVAFAIWADPAEIDAVVETYGPAPFRPSLNPLSALVVHARSSGRLRLPPRSNDDLGAYWRYMGEDARRKLTSDLRRHGVSDPARRDELMRQIGLGIATEHLAATRDDVKRGLGQEPGRLSLRQITDYHHLVLARFGLPPTGFGGTPYAAIPDSIELALAGGVWGSQADPSESPAG